MKLTYRGISYNYTPTVLATEQVGLMGRYRGARMPFSWVPNPPVSLRGVELMYRGIAYSPGDRPITSTPTESDRPQERSVRDISIKERMRMLLTGHVRNVRRREQAMLARADEKVGLPPESAANVETSIQGKVPHDFSGYDRSGASMS